MQDSGSYVSGARDTKMFSRWCEKAGSPCDPWTQVGNKRRWLEKSTLPFMVWFFSTLYMEPDEVHHENSVLFDDVMFQKLAGMRTQKDVLSRPLQRGQRPRSYRLERLVFNIRDLGIAGSRNRSWRHMTLEDILEAVVPPHKYQGTFKNIFYRQRVTTSAIYNTERAKALLPSYQELWLKDRGEEWQVDALTHARTAGPDGEDHADSLEIGCEPAGMTDYDQAIVRSEFICDLAKSMGPFCDATFKARLAGYKDMMQQKVDAGQEIVFLIIGGLEIDSSNNAWDGWWAVGLGARVEGLAQAAWGWLGTKGRSISRELCYQWVICALICSESTSTKIPSDF